MRRAVAIVAGMCVVGSAVAVVRAAEPARQTTIKGGKLALITLHTAKFPAGAEVSMGVFGGDSLGLLRSEATSIGKDIAVFLDAWARGKSLK